MLSENKNPYLAKDNKKLPQDEIEEKIWSHIELLTSREFCRNFDRVGFFTKCSCISSNFFGDRETPKILLLFKLLKQYESNSETSRQIILHGIITNANIRRTTRNRGGYSQPSYSLPGVKHDRDNDDDADTNREDVCVCINGLRWLFFIGRKKIERLKVEARLPNPNEKKKEIMSGNKRAECSCVNEVLTYLDEIGELEGEPYATRFVRTLAGYELRDDEKGVIELPPSYSKRKLYERFCYENGWIAKSDAKGVYKKWSNYGRREHDDHLGVMASWPSTCDAKEICSWATFYYIWKNKREKIRIRPPGRDTCMQCNIYRNQSKYLNDANTDINSCNIVDIGASILGASNAEERDEGLILAAATHVKAAVSQKELAAEKIEQAKASLNLPYNEKVVTLVMDYCQNLELPHVGGEQVGDTYYYSPIALYCLGIVDAAINQLYAYVYSEADGRKGGNNSSSILLHHLKTKVFKTHSGPIAELNVIMDNCVGQNKNRMIIRSAALCIEMGWVKKVNLIFLIKGHTKNACDRNFNLLKSEWRKRDIYTMEQTFEVLNISDNVEAINAAGCFRDWDKMYEKYYRKPESGTVVMNHVFSFEYTTNKLQVSMITQEYNNSQGFYTQQLVKNSRSMTPAIRRLSLLYDTPELMSEPGLPAIKHVDLFTKWRQVVPFEFKDITCPEPSQEIKEKAKNDRKKSKGIDYVEEDGVVTNNAEVSKARGRGRPRKCDAILTSARANTDETTKETPKLPKPVRTPKRKKLTSVSSNRAHKTSTPSKLNKVIPSSVQFLPQESSNKTLTSSTMMPPPKPNMNKIIEVAAQNVQILGPDVEIEIDNNDIDENDIDNFFNDEDTITEVDTVSSSVQRSVIKSTQEIQTSPIQKKTKPHQENIITRELRQRTRSLIRDEKIAAKKPRREAWLKRFDNTTTTARRSPRKREDNDPGGSTIKHAMV